MLSSHSEISVHQRYKQGFEANMEFKAMLWNDPNEQTAVLVHKHYLWQHLKVTHRFHHTWPSEASVAVVS